MLSSFKTALDQANHVRFFLQSGYPVWATFGDGVTYCIFAAERISARQFNYLSDKNQQIRLVSRVHQQHNTKHTTSDNSWHIMEMPLTPDMTLESIALSIDPLSVSTPQDLKLSRKVPAESLEDFDTLLRLCRRFQVLPALVVFEDTPQEDATYFQRQDINLLLDAPVEVQLVSHATVPVTGRSDARLYTFRTTDTQEEHYALVCGDMENTTELPTVRMHSACLTGDVFGSLKCDCGPQLHAAMDQITQAQVGILVYLMQEGRGIGLVNKMRAYALQDHGRDTVEANHALGFNDDERDFRVGAAILKALKATRIKLLTNNPRKVNGLAEHDLNVTQRVPLRVEPTQQNAQYLRVKAEKSGHLL